jgi:probable phosphomutase (TIGR03848 family)
MPYDDDMTVFYLVRHGETGARKINGRRTGVHLNHEGHAQAQIMAERFANIPVAALYSSPLERTMDTAQYLSRQLNLPIQTVNAIIEIDFGDWTGKTLEDLANDPQWQHFNSFRSGRRIPGGETMLEVQQRFVNWMDTVRRQHINQRIVVVSHGDPIKAAIMNYLGMHLDMYDRFDIGLTSVSILSVADDQARVLTVNNMGKLPC